MGDCLLPVINILTTFWLSENHLNLPPFKYQLGIPEPHVHHTAQAKWSFVKPLARTTAHVQPVAVTGTTGIQIHQSHC